MSIGGGSGSVTGFLTGGLIDPVTPDYAGAATQAEKGRQALINAGLQDINAVFSGGTVPQFDLAQGTYNPKQQYFLFKPGAKGNQLYRPWNVKTNPPYSGVGTALGQVGGTIVAGPPGGALGGLFGGLSDSLFGKDSPPNYRGKYAGMVGRDLLYTRGTPKSYSGFGPDFFNNAAQAYVDYAMPQLTKQYNDTNRSITYGLANRGLIGSGAEKRAQSDLSLTTGQAEQTVADNARSVGQGLKSQIEAARQAAIDSLYQSASPSGALQQSISSAAQFSVPQTFTPLLNAFSGLANQYATNYLYNPPVSSTSYSNPYINFYGQGQSNNAGALPPASY